MGKRTRGRHPPKRLATPETTTTPSTLSSDATDPDRSLLDAIADGDLDPHLTALAEAIHARQHLLRTVRSATALAMLCPGDRVRINRAVTPQYLCGLHGTIIDLDDRAATVHLDRPVGRFHSGQVRCPPLVLEKV